MFALTPTHALTSETVTIDGSFDDWVPVKADPDNMLQDTVIPNDPDTPGQPDRDIQYVGATWDSTYLYLYWRRTANGTKAITFGAYIDRGNDRSLNSTDMVAWFTLGNGRPHAQAPGGAGLLWYEPASPSGADTMGADGATPLGTAWKLDAGAPVTMEGYLSSAGIEVEGRIPWSALRLAPGSPVNIHFCCGNGVKFAPQPDGQIEDNVGGPLSLTQRAVSVTPDRVGGVAAGGTVSYAHTISNSGNTTETFDLSAVSSSGWDARIYSSGGITPIASVTLGPGQTYGILAKVAVPATTTAGTGDVTQVTATCQADPAVTGTASDTTRVGNLTITPDHSYALTPDSIGLYAHDVMNNTSATQTIVLSATSSAGWPVEVRDAGGGSTLATITLGPGETIAVIARLAIPATATIGIQDVTTVQAVLASDPSIFATAHDTTRVEPVLDIAPDNSASAGPQTIVSYSHTITNSTAATAVVGLSAVSSAGWTVYFYDSDLVTRITMVAVGPLGGTRVVNVRISVPAVTEGIVDTTTVTATADGHTASSTDVTTVHQLVLYGTPGRTRESTSFSLGSTAYAQGAGLPPKSNVRFAWVDPSGSIASTGPLTTVDANGLAFADYTFGLSAPLGVWSCRLLDGTGKTLHTVPFTASVKGTISALTANGASDPGQPVLVDTTLSGSGPATIPASTATYVVWWDDNGSGAFDAGDTYIDAAGAAHTWDGVSSVSTHVSNLPTLMPGETWSESGGGWSVSNAGFPYRGTYHVTETWRTSGGLLIDTKTTSFYSVPVLGALIVLFIALLVAPLAWLLRRRRRWLMYYVLSAFAFTLLSVLFLQQTGTDSLVASWENAQVAWLATLVGFPVRTAALGGLVIANPAGWSLLKIGIECSAVIEMTVLVGLVGFYPGFPVRDRVGLAAAGVAATYLVNLARLAIIVGIAARFGPGSLFVAHAIVGRTFFFICVVALYWWLLTRTTLQRLRKELSGA
jgi:exosortase family protein XrtG